MDQPTLKPVRATGRGQTLYRRLGLIGLVSAAVVFASLARAAPSPDRHVPAVIPTQSVELGSVEWSRKTGEPASPAPTPRGTSHQSASPMLAPGPKDAGWDQTFGSALFGYTLRYPDGWTTRAATRADLSDWIKAPLPSMTALSISRIPRPEGAGLPAFAQAHLPHRAEEGCRSGPGALDGLHEITVDGRGGAYRSECGYVDALVQEGDDFLKIIFRPSQTRRADNLWWFERFIEHLDFPEGHPRPTPAPTSDDFAWDKTFTSDRFGFSIRYPEGWIPVAAIDSNPDRIMAPSPSRTVISIRRSPMPEGQDFLAFADRHLRHRAEPDGCRWNSAGIIFIPAEWDTLHEIAVDGHPGAFRSECSHVDAVVHVGDEFLGITVTSGARRATGDLWWFERFVETLELDTSIAFDR